MKTFSFTALFIISGFVHAQTALDAYILNKMEDEHISGLGAALVKDGELLWFGNYGLANREENIPHELFIHVFRNIYAGICFENNYRNSRNATV
jgi:CubicO group peptidase (beta-lactamase class C family)